MIKRVAMYAATVTLTAMLSAAAAAQDGTSSGPSDRILRSGAKVQANADGSVTVTLAGGKALQLACHAALPPTGAEGQFACKTGEGAHTFTAGAWVKLGAASPHTHAAADITSGTIGAARGGTGLSALGTPSQQLRVNAGATALEYFTPAAGATANATTGVLPYLSAAGVFGDSPVTRVSSSTVSVGHFGAGTWASSGTFFEIKKAGADSATAYNAVGNGTDFYLNAAGTLNLNLGGSSASRWQLVGGGHFVTANDGTQSIGGAAGSLTSTTNRPLNLNLAGTWRAGDGGARPTCDASTRGVYWHDFGGAGAADSVALCVKQSSDTYAWVSVATVP